MNDFLRPCLLGEQKLVAVSTMIPLLRKKVESDQTALSAKRAGTLEGYKAMAEKCGISWRTEAAEVNTTSCEPSGEAIDSV